MKKFNLTCPKCGERTHAIYSEIPTLKSIKNRRYCFCCDIVWRIEYRKES